MSEITWRFVPFDALTSRELYEVLQLRSAVFVVEQACVFQDMDGADVQAMHLLGTVSGQLAAYARCFAAGVKFAEASIGRVVTQGSQRGSGAGHALMRQAITSVTQHWGPQPIRIGAQARLEQFYRQHGFVKTGAPYSEDGIPHIEMLRPA
ncbi:GNAT family N-acetyltransferase [Polaromonas sp. JS666]|uniref:GNAT family N-acetyltransferase n=1 Tax=Polaromonas sp. (strain JS666 / ATCC BAA-500) TaxID=296591 RepID=UPI00004647AF|nr:GNAT family N-acetyltransferase [Polaromonas sp. JS666]ABE44478.1 GCN5-related N-acetyltransferase [Polaromonas sp. JS666]